MSDFDTLPMENVEDPAADFLAREQKDLADLDDEFNFSNTNEVASKISNLSDDIRDEINEMNENYSNGDADEIANHINGLKLDDSYGRSSQSEKSQPPREEPEKIKKWREEQKRLLEQKDVEEGKKIEELKQTAKRELEEWYARYSEQLEKSKHSNRNAEKEWVAERDAEIPGQEWEKIAKMCDFNPKATRNVKDTTRMRSILLQLKQANTHLNKS